MKTTNNTGMAIIKMLKVKLKKDNGYKVKDKNGYQKGKFILNIRFIEGMYK